MKKTTEGAGHQNKIQKAVWGKVAWTFNLFTLLSSVWRTGSHSTQILSHPSCLQCGCLLFLFSCFASFFTQLALVPPLYQVPAIKEKTSHTAEDGHAQWGCRAGIGHSRGEPETASSRSLSNSFSVFISKWARERIVKNCPFSEDHWLPSTKHMLL